MKSLPRIITGCMKWGQWGSGFSTQQYLANIEQCIEVGAYAFDHADIYGDYSTEAEFGQALSIVPSLRQQLILISKCGIQMVSEKRPRHHIKSYNTSRSNIISSVEQSLRNLQTDYL